MYQVRQLTGLFGAPEGLEDRPGGSLGGVLEYLRPAKGGSRRLGRTANSYS